MPRRSARRTTNNNAAAASESEADSATSASTVATSTRRKSVRLGSAAARDDGRKARKQQRSSSLPLQPQPESSADERDEVITASQLVLSPASQSQTQHQHQRRPAAVSKAIKSSGNRLNVVVSGRRTTRAVIESESESVSGSEAGAVAGREQVTAEEEGEDDDEGDTTIYANISAEEVEVSAEEPGLQPSESQDAYENGYDSEADIALEELVEEAQTNLQALLQKDTLELTRDEKRDLRNFRRKSRILAANGEAEGAGPDLALSTLSQSMLLNTRFPDTARGAKIVNLYLATGALLAYRADRRHTYDPDTGLRLLAFIDDHFRHIFTNRSLLQADEQLIDCWLEIKRQRLRLQTDIDVELADVREIFDITSTLEKKLSLANKAGLIDYWAEVQDRIEAEPDRIDPSVHTFDGFLEIIMQQAGRHLDVLLTSVQNGKEPSPDSSSPAKSPQKRVSAVKGHRQGDVSARNGRLSIPLQATVQTNGRSASPVINARAADRKGKGRASMPGQIFPSAGGHNPLLADLEAQALRKKRASMGGSVQSLRQRLVRLEQLERSSPVSSARSSIAALPARMAAEQDEQPADDSIQAVSKMLLFSGGKSKARVTHNATRVNGHVPPESEEEEEEETQTQAAGARYGETQATEANFDEDMEDLINNTFDAPLESQTGSDVFGAVDTEVKEEPQNAHPRPGQSRPVLESQTLTQSQPIDPELEDLVMAEAFDLVDRSAELVRTIPSSSYASQRSAERRSASGQQPYRETSSAAASPVPGRATASLARAAGPIRVSFDSQGGLRRASAGTAAQGRKNLLASMLERQDDAERIEMDTPPERREQARIAAASRRPQIQPHFEISVPIVAGRRKEKPVPADDFYGNELEQMPEPENRDDDFFHDAAPAVYHVEFSDEEQDEPLIDQALQADDELPPPLSARGPPSPPKSILKPYSGRKSFVEVSTSVSSSAEDSDDDEDEDVQRLLTARKGSDKKISYSRAIKPVSSQNERSKDPEKAYKRAPPPGWKGTTVRPVVMESSGSKRKRPVAVESESDQEVGLGAVAAEEEQKTAGAAVQSEEEYVYPVRRPETGPVHSSSRRSSQVARITTGPPRAQIEQQAQVKARRSRPVIFSDDDVADAPEPKRPRGRPRKHPRADSPPAVQDQPTNPLFSDEEDEDNVDDPSEDDRQVIAGPSRTSGRATKATTFGSQVDELQSDDTSAHESSSEYDPNTDQNRTPTQANNPVANGKGKGKAVRSSGTASASSSAVGKGKPGRPRKAASSASKKATPKAAKGGPSRYKMGGYNHWTQEETDCILECLREDKNMTVKEMLKFHGKDGQQSNTLENRKNDSIKDKIHEIAKRREVNGQPRLPWYEDWVYSEKTGKLVKGKRRKDDDDDA